MAKEEGSKTIVYGGRSSVQQQYCGTVGGQSTDFSTIDSEVKTSGLKNNSLAPPDFTTNSVQGITWRLGFGIDDPAQPEEWQNHPADVNLPLTADMCVYSPLLPFVLSIDDIAFLQCEQPARYLAEGGGHGVLKVHSSYPLAVI